MVYQFVAVVVVGGAAVVGGVVAVLCYYYNLYQYVHSDRITAGCACFGCRLHHVALTDQKVTSLTFLFTFSFFSGRRIVFATVGRSNLVSGLELCFQVLWTDLLPQTQDRPNKQPIDLQIRLHKTSRRDIYINFALITRHRSNAVVAPLFPCYDKSYGLLFIFSMFVCCPVNPLAIYLYNWKAHNQDCEWLWSYDAFWWMTILMRGFIWKTLKNHFIHSFAQVLGAQFEFLLLKLEVSEWKNSISHPNSLPGMQNYNWISSMSSLHLKLMGNFVECKKTDEDSAVICSTWRKEE